MIRYVFNEDEPLRIKAAGKANPQIIGTALQEIATASDGRLTPKAVVDAARSRKSPLHPHFEWDDAAAAESYRMDQARNLIRIVRVEDDTAEDGLARAFISIASDNGTAYRSLEAVRSSIDFQVALLNRAKADLAAFQNRYRQMADICKIVLAAEQELDRRINTIETRAAA